MQITDIKEAGSNNTLMWALKNGADLKTDDALNSLINDEYFYLVTFSDVNFFELFRLTQIYRDRLRIMNEKQAVMPLRRETNFLFPGIYTPPAESGDQPVNKCEIAEHTIKEFIDLAQQMMADDDIINSNAVRLFLPMISRKFDVQIPVSFIDFASSMSQDESTRLFSLDYPNNLNDILDSENHSIKTLLNVGFVKSTQIIKYNERYDKYLKSIRYFPIYKDKRTSPFKMGLLGFHKRDPIARAEILFSLFKPNSTTPLSMKKMKRINTPLDLDIIIQLPIQYMQILENSFDNNTVLIQYESSMSHIIDTGIRYEDFKLKDVVNPEDDDEKTRIDNHNNQIEAYRVRISEANNLLLSSISILLSPEGEEDNTSDTTSTFAMLPGIYMSTAVMTISETDLPKLLNHSDPLLHEIFEEVQNLFKSVNENISSAE